MQAAAYEMIHFAEREQKLARERAEAERAEAERAERETPGSVD